MLEFPSWDSFFGFVGDRQGDVHVNGAVREVAKLSFAPYGRQKVPLSCLFFVVIQQRRGDFDHFARAQEDRLPVPTDVAVLPKPIVGFFGLLERWIDLDLVDFDGGKAGDGYVQPFCDKKRLEFRQFECQRFSIPFAFLAQLVFGDPEGTLLGFGKMLNPHSWDL